MTYRKDDRKEQLNLKIKKSLIYQIKQIPKYTPKIEKLLEENLEKLKREY